MRGKDSKTLLKEIKKIIAQYDTKLTVRQIYYQLVSKHLIENTISQYQRVSRIIVKARYNGDIAWEDIEDRTRQAKGGDEVEKTIEEYFSDVLNYFQTSYMYYNLPTWKNQWIYLEVWYEKQALEGIFDSVARKYNVTHLACKGYSSHTMGFELLKRVKRFGEGRETHIVYFGDFDPSGMDIYRFIQDMCKRFGLEIDFERVAITKEQIKKYNIPPMMAKSSDSRYNNFVAEYGTDVVELDALDPKILIELIEESIRKRFDFEIYKEVKKKEERDRKKLKKMINEIVNR